MFRVILARDVGRRPVRSCDRAEYRETHAARRAQCDKQRHLLQVGKFAPFSYVWIAFGEKLGWAGFGF